LPLEIGAEQYYDMIEVDDFNKLFTNPNHIDECFGKTLSVTLNLERREIKRDIIEHPEKVRVN